MPMFDRRRTRQLLIFLGNVVSGVVALVAIFFGVVYTVDSGPAGPLLVIVGVPAVGILGWRIGLDLRVRDQAKVKQVAWQAFRVLIAWEAAALVVTGIFIYVAFSAMAPVPHNTGEVLDLLLISAVVALALWFTWMKSRRMVDLLWPLPGTAQQGSESPYLQMKL